MEIKFGGNLINLAIFEKLECSVVFKFYVVNIRSENFNGNFHN